MQRVYHSGPGMLVNRHPAYASGWAPVPNSFFDFATMLGLTPYERLVWLHLFRRTQGGRGVAFPSVPRLAGECGISVRSVQKAIKGLVLSGMVRRAERRDHRGAPTTPEYDVAPLLRRLDSMQKRRGVVSVVHHPGAPGAPEVDSTEEDIKKELSRAGEIFDVLRTFRALPGVKPDRRDPAVIERLAREFGADSVRSIIAQFGTRIASADRPRQYLVALCEKAGASSTLETDPTAVERARRVLDG